MKRNPVCTPLSSSIHDKSSEMKTMDHIEKHADAISVRDSKTSFQEYLFQPIALHYNLPEKLNKEEWKLGRIKNSQTRNSQVLCIYISAFQSGVFMGFLRWVSVSIPVSCPFSWAPFHLFDFFVLF